VGGNAAHGAGQGKIALTVYRLSIYGKTVIRSFRDAETGRVFLGTRSRKFQAIEKIANRELFQLHPARTLHDLRAPGNSPEAFKGGRAGQQSIRINGRYRLCFIWEDGDAYPGGNRRLSLTRRIAMIKPPHPGEIIQEDYLLPLGIGTARLNEIVLGKRGITADTALRLARCLGARAEFCLNAICAWPTARLAVKIERTVKPLKGACSRSGSP
jgi:proteic killer suppression protein